MQFSTHCGLCVVDIIIWQILYSELLSLVCNLETIGWFSPVRTFHRWITTLALPPIAKEGHRGFQKLAGSYRNSNLVSGQLCTALVA